MSQAKDVLRGIRRAIARLGGPHNIEVLFRDVHGTDHMVQSEMTTRGGPNRAVILVEKTRED